MADVTTAVYQFIAPDVGGSDNTWGDKLNANIMALEALFVDAFTGGTPTDIGKLKTANANMATQAVADTGTATNSFMSPSTVKVASDKRYLQLNLATAQAVIGAGLITFAGAVQGIAPVNAADFTTKSYVDAQIGGTFSQAQADARYLQLTGGTLTGGLIGTSASLSSTLTVGGNTAPGAISLNGPAAQIRAINFTTAGVMRWAVFANNTAESGSNNGSGFGINRYSDAGVFLDMPFSISRPSGSATFQVNGANAAIVDAAGGATGSALTVMTREKGDARYLQLVGGTVTGPMSIATQINIVSPAGASHQLASYVGTNPRWSIDLGNNVAESGSNAGSDFAITRFSDVGAYLNSPIVITRSSGAVSINNSLWVGAATTINAALGVAGALTSSTTIWANTAITTPGYMSCTGAMTAASHNLSGDSNFWLGTNGTENLLNFAGGWFLGFARSGGFLRWVTQNNTLQAMTVDYQGTLTVAGNAFKNGGGPWAATSDARIKTVEADYAAGLEQVLALQPVIYHYNGNDADPNSTLDEPEVKAVQKSYVGLIAQAVELIMPEMVYQEEGWIDGEKVTDLRKLDSGPLIYAIVNAIKTIADRLDALEAA